MNAKKLFRYLSLSGAVLILLTFCAYGFSEKKHAGLEKSATDIKKTVRSAPSSENTNTDKKEKEKKPAKQTIADNTLLGRWTFDDTDAGRNVAVREYPASVTKRTRITDGITGKAIALSVRDSAKLSIKVSPDMLPVGLREFTFFAWLAPDKFEKDASILSKEDVGLHGENRMLLTFRNNGQFLALGINCGENYAECSAPVSPRELCDGRWHLVAGTFDKQNTMRVYLDGRELGSFERQTTINTVRDFTPTKSWRDAIANDDYQSLEDVTVQGEPLFIGSTNGKKNFFNGKIDEVRFYSRALDEKLIAGLYAEGKQPASDVVNKAREIAAALYKKDDSFLETLASIDKNITKSAKPDEICAVELSYLLHRDYPEETNAYLMKWKKNPVANLLLDEKQRRESASKLAEPAFEYLPLTDMQWQVLPKDERSRWERVKAMRSLFNNDATALLADAKVDKNALGTILYEMEALVEERPSKNEPVAKYVKPATPKTVNRTSDEARKVIEKDWLFQCDNKPTVERSLKEIEWARKLVARLPLETGISNAFKDKLKALESKAKAKKADDEDTELYFAIRTVKREIQFSNPVINFESILYIDNPNPGGSESNHETRHRLGYSAVPGGRLIVQTGLNPAGEMKQLMPQAPLHGTFWRPDLSYDGKRILFSFKPHNEKTFHIYEIGIDGSELRQLTGGIFDDLDPIYMPDGNMMFLTTRGHIYVRCMPPTNAFVMARMPLNSKPGEKSLYLISRSGEPEYSPSVLDDGRVIYTRWEYTDKPLWRAQSLWTMRQNGTMVQTFWGNQSVWPDLLKDARQIPGSERIMFTGSAHHNWFSGSVGIIDPSKGFNFPDGLTKVTRDVSWPESGNGPVDPGESEDYHSSGRYEAYYSPYPLSETDFIVSAQRKGSWKFVLLLMDVYGNREIINEGTNNIWYAVPVRSRPVPPVHPDMVEWPDWENRDNPKPGTIYSNNVYEGASEELKGKAKYLRIWSIDHKTYTYWFKRNYLSAGPEISAVQSEGVKRIIGTVPIEEDGSVSFVAPSGIAMHFQLLDENHRALQTMRSFTGVQPTEMRGCMGCHESHTRAPESRSIGKAMQRKPSKITPVPWEDVTVGYERYVQPVLNKNCAQCHQNPKHEGYKHFNATLRPGFLSFKEPYMTLLGYPTWGAAYKDRSNNKCGGFGWADVILVESFGTLDSAAYISPKPMTKLSYKSRLVDIMSSGRHHGVKVTGDDLMRVILWVDAMGPYNGAEELLNMEDPMFQGKDWISQRPRIKTAPIVRRPGPFDPFETDDAYDTPATGTYNRLPACVQR